MGDTTYGTIADADKVDVRRYCGYPAYGAGPSGFQGWRFFQAYGLLEYRMNNMGVSEVAVVETYLTTLRTLESAIPGAGATLGTDQAAVWTRNKNEVSDRINLFDSWRRRLAEFIGVPFGENIGNNQFQRVI